MSVINPIEQLVNMVPWEQVTISKNSNGEYLVGYNDCYVKKGVSKIERIYGKGTNIEFAAKDYLRKISGKTVIFHSADENRRQEFTLTRV